MPEPFLELREIIVRNGGFHEIDLSEADKLIAAGLEMNPEDSDLWGAKALFEWCTKPGPGYKQTIKRAIELGYSAERLAAATSLREDEIQAIVSGK